MIRNYRYPCLFVPLFLDEYHDTMCGMMTMTTMICFGSFFFFFAIKLGFAQMLRYSRTSQSEGGAHIFCRPICITDFSFGYHLDKFMHLEARPLIIARENPAQLQTIEVRKWRRRPVRFAVREKISHIIVVRSLVASSRVVSGTNVRSSYIVVPGAHSIARRIFWNIAMFVSIQTWYNTIASTLLGILLVSASPGWAALPDVIQPPISVSYPITTLPYGCNTL